MKRMVINPPDDTPLPDSHGDEQGAARPPVAICFVLLRAIGLPLIGGAGR
jgi:hypothetical protein